MLPQIGGMMSTLKIDSLDVKFKRNLEKVEQMISKDLAEIQKKDLSLVFDKVIDEYYQEYLADYDNTGHGLYDLMTFGEDEGGMYMYFDPDRIDYDHSRDSNWSTEKYEFATGITNPSGFKQYLFDIAFVEGWHGGANRIAGYKAHIFGKHPESGRSNPAPYYRSGKYFKNWGKKSYRSPGERVSPFDKMEDRAQERARTKYTEEAKRIYEKYAYHLLDL